jgi:hypothetical protein
MYTRPCPALRGWDPPPYGGDPIVFPNPWLQRIKSDIWAISDEEEESPGTTGAAVPGVQRSRTRAPSLRG